MSSEQSQDPNTAQQIDYCHEVLTTIKFCGVIIKPQAFIQLSDAEAAPMIAKGYISAEQVLPPTDDNVERCESGAPDCGPVEFYDSEGVPLCRRCYDSLSTDTSSVTADLSGGDQSVQVAAGEADAANESETELHGAQSADTEGQASDTATANAALSAGGESPAGGAAIEILQGSDKFPALIKVGDDDVQLGEFVQAAFARNETASADDWNALPQEKRDELIQAEVDARLAALKPAKPTKPAKTK